MASRIICSFPEYLSKRTKWVGDCLLWTSCLNTNGYGWLFGKLATDYGTQLKFGWGNNMDKWHFTFFVAAGLLTVHAAVNVLMALVDNGSILL